MEEIDSLIKEIEDLIQELNEILIEGSEDKRFKLSTKLKGLIRGLFGDQREKDYLHYINLGVRFLNEKAAFEKKTSQMISFLESIKEELLSQKKFKSIIEPNLNKVEKNLEKAQKENERSRNVAEFKYWHFAIELIEIVRKELKKFKQTQDSLLKSIEELREDLKGSKNL